MKTIQPFSEDLTGTQGQYYPVTYKDGRVTCSCGRELMKIDEHTYQCTGGYPIYRFDEGDIIKDKFGNLMMKAKEH